MVLRMCALGLSVLPCLALTSALAAPAEPAAPGVISQPSGMDVLWQPQPVVTGTPGEPATVNIYVVNNDVGKTIQLPGLKPAATPGAADTAVQCDWYPGPGHCIYCPDAGDYLDPASAAKVTGVTVMTAASKDGLVSVRGLDRSKKYTVFLQYAPNGVAPSECLQAYSY